MAETEIEKKKVHIAPLAALEVAHHGFTHWACIDPQLQELEEPKLPEGAEMEEEKTETVIHRNMFGQEDKTELELHLLKIKEPEHLYRVAGMREGPSEEDAKLLGIREIEDEPKSGGSHKKKASNHGDASS